MPERVRVAELVACLGLASTYVTGAPDDHALRACLVATRFGRHLDLDLVELATVYNLALLRLVGCVSTSHHIATVVGDDVAIGGWFTTQDMFDERSLVPTMLRNVGAGEPPHRRARRIAAMLTRMERMEVMRTAHCEVGRLLAAELGMAPPVVAGLDQVYERWNGKGQPLGLRGEEIDRTVRLVAIAVGADTYERHLGPEGAAALVAERAGKSFDPELAAEFAGHGPQILAELDATTGITTLLDEEPGSRRVLQGPELDRALRAVADFADLKSPWTIGHSRQVADLAAGAAAACGLPPDDVGRARRAGWIHDLGRCAIGSDVWARPGPLSEADWERVRLHPYYTERILARAPGLADLTVIASRHHERLDGSGYHRGSVAEELTPVMRVLAAADVYQALRSERPHRPARDAEQAAAELEAEVRAGRLDEMAVRGVLQAAGHAVRPPDPRGQELPNGLTERELDVLRLLARGLRNREIAQTLFVSEKTAGNHVQHIYGKLEVSSRAAATLFALQHGLV